MKILSHFLKIGSGGSLLSRHLQLLGVRKTQLCSKDTSLSLKVISAAVEWWGLSSLHSHPLAQMFKDLP